MDCSTPCGPKSTTSTAFVSETHIQTTSAPLAASAGDSAVRAPSILLPGVRFQTATSFPAFTRFAAIGRPIMPSPKNATRIAISHRSVIDLARERPVARQKKQDGTRPSVRRYSTRIKYDDRNDGQAICRELAVKYGYCFPYPVFRRAGPEMRSFVSPRHPMKCRDQGSGPWVYWAR